MDVLLYLIPLVLLMGFGAVIAFVWALRSGQYEDLEGEARRILIDADDDVVITGKGEKTGGGDEDNHGKE